MMVANPNPNRPPLLPSERRDHNSHNGAAPNPNPNLNPTRPKSKPVSSRYLLSPATSSSSSSVSSTSSSSTSFSTPRRCPSPMAPRTSTPAEKSRSASADRRRRSPLRCDDVSPATKLTSIRSLSVSFQGEAFSLPVSKTKAAAPPAALRRGTPERRRPGTPAAENPKRGDQHRWPARIRQVNCNPNNPNCGNILLKSFDNTLDDDYNKHNVVGSDANKLGNSCIESNNKYSNESNDKLDSSELLKSIRRYPDGISNDTDSDSVSSDSTNSGRTVNSMKFWQEPCTRTNLPKYPPKMMVPPKFGQPKKFPNEIQMGSTRINSSPMRNLNRPSSPMRGSIRASSPSKIRASIESLPSRGMASPIRVRVPLSGGGGEKPSVLSYAVDVKRGKVGENQIEDAHTLRLLYNRHLQWQFVNAKKEAVLAAQRRSVQENLWNTWVKISNLRESVTRKTHRLHLMKQKLKLACILKDEITYLEDWASLDTDHCMSLLGSIEALKGSTLRLPVVDGAITDLQSIKDSIGSAVDVMQAMGSSICSLLLKVEKMNSVATELTKEVSKEQSLLEQCKEDFTKLAALQVEYCSLRTHILQDNRTQN